jgi:ABC-type spermidine/putrescine transport system permease subunit I
MAFPVAYFIALRAQEKYRNILLFLLTVPFWTSFLVQAYAWFFLLDRFGVINKILQFIGLINDPLPLSNSLLAILFVMIYCYLPFMILPIYTVLQKIDKRVLEASYDLGATYWQTMRAITFPLSLSGIQVGSLLVLVPSFGEFIIPVLMGGSKYLFVGPLISHYILVSHNSHVGAAFMFLSGFILLLFVRVINRLVRYLIT